MNFEQKKEYLIRAPDIVTLAEAENTVAPWFLRIGSGKSKPKANLKNYYFFHKDCRIGIYSDKQKFYLVFINVHRPFLGFKGRVTVLEVSEILKDTWDFFEESRVSGSSTFIKHTNSEKLFLKYIISFNENPEIEKQALIKEKELEEEAKKQALIKEKELEEEAKKQALIKEKELEEEPKKQALIKKEKEAEEKAEREKQELEQRKKERAERKKKLAEQEAKRKKQAALALARYQEKIKLLTDKYGEKVAKAFDSKRVEIGMPISYVNELKGSGHDRKRSVSKEGESIKEKYGKYFKELSGGKKSSNPSYKMEIEYERSEDGSSWLVSSYKDY